MNGLILAIDPSLTNTACVLGDGQQMHIKCFGTKASGDLVSQRLMRYESLLSRIADWLEEPVLSAIYIEGYSFGSVDSRARYAAEYGGLLRERLYGFTSRIYEVAPTTLKKFATGKGAGKKEMVIAHLMKRYNVEFATNDEFDAYGLYRLGLVVEGLEEAQNQAQRECVDKVLGRGVTKKPKAKGA